MSGTPNWINESRSNNFGCSRKFELVRYSNLCSELFECECNIINGDWTLLSEQHCRASMALLLRKMRTRIDLDGDLYISLFRKRGSEIVCRSRVFAIFRASKGVSERSPNSPAIHDERANRVLASTRWINTLVPVGLPFVQGVPVVAHFLSFTDARYDQYNILSQYEAVIRYSNYQ